MVNREDFDNEIDFWIAKYSDEMWNGYGNKRQIQEARAEIIRLKNLGSVPSSVGLSTLMRLQEPFETLEAEGECQK